MFFTSKYLPSESTCSFIQTFQALKHSLGSFCESAVLNSTFSCGCLHLTESGFLWDNFSFLVKEKICVEQNLLKCWYLFFTENWGTRNFIKTLVHMPGWQSVLRHLDFSSVLLITGWPGFLSSLTFPLLNTSLHTSDTGALDWAFSSYAAQNWLKNLEAVFLIFARNWCSHIVQPVFRCVRKIAKSNYYFRHVCLFVHPST